MSQIRVLLAEDHLLVREGIRALLLSLEGIDVVAEANDGREALGLIQKHQPDVVLMDIAMPGLNGLEAAARTVKECPTTRVIMLSMHANQEYVRQALRAGVAGYLLKGADISELEFAIRSVARGEIYLTPVVTKHVVQEFIRPQEHESDGLAGLSSRQREILQLIAEGQTTKGIAQLLNLSVKTVESHRMQLMERLNIRDVPGLVRYALRVGLISPDN
jgi:DNA-binding NarL/FixJ family response regulator